MPAASPLRRRKHHMDEVHRLTHTLLLTGQQPDLVLAWIQTNDAHQRCSLKQVHQRTGRFHVPVVGFEQNHFRPGRKGPGHGVGLPAVHDVKLDLVKMLPQTRGDPFRQERRGHQDDNTGSRQAFSSVWRSSHRQSSLP